MLAYMQAPCTSRKPHQHALSQIMGLKGCQNANEAMRALSAGGELPGGLQKQVMKAINIAHVARSFILEIYMYFKHSELEGISGKRKFLVVSCDRSLVKSFGQVLWLAYFWVVTFRRTDGLKSYRVFWNPECPMRLLHTKNKFRGVIK